MKNTILFFFLLFSASLSAQLNPKHIYVNSQSAALSQIEINSFSQYPQIVTLPSSGSDSLAVHYTSLNTYQLSFLPHSGFLGNTDIVVEYYEQGPFPGIPYPNYTTIHYAVKQSLIETNSDHYLCDQTLTTLDVLSNDSNSHGNLVLDKLGAVSGGTAEIVGNSISFQFDSNADNAFIRYFVKDSLSNVESGIAYITRENSDIIEDRRLSTDNKDKIRISLNSVDFEIEDAPTNGVLSHGSQGNVWYYNSNSGFTGTDTVTFSSPSGGLLSYTIQVLDKEDDRDLVQDDEYFVEVDGALSFNVQDNDFRDDRTIVDYSSELTYNGNGDFTYSPPSGFVGDKVFFYKVFTGLAIQTADVVIHVDNFAPVSEFLYEYSILNDHELKITHDNPLSSYSYNLAISPSYGNVTILGQNDAEILECATIVGDNTILYTPNPGFSGLDEFDLEYCTDSGICEIVKIDVNVLDSNYEDCLCLNDCVYQGDTNDDGIVDMKDVLDMALNIGQAGYDRDNDFNLIWTGQDSDDWGYQQMNAGIDLKCGDADGDGYIDNSDFEEVYQNYGQVHKLVSPLTANASQVPIYFIPPSTPVDSGEWISLEIAVGTDGVPAIDFYGTSFTLNINPDIIDSSSVTFTLYDDNWLGYESPLESMYFVPQDGQVDIGISRINNISTDGFGIIGKLDFIVEDEIVGFKRNSLLEASSLVTMNNILSTNEYGEYHAHPVFSDNIKLSQDGRYDEEEFGLSLSVMPNPTSDFITIESSKFSIDKIEFIDALGRIVHSTSQAYTQAYNLDISSFNQGTYFVRVTSNQRTSVKKIQKID